MARVGIYLSIYLDKRALSTYLASLPTFPILSPCTLDQPTLCAMKGRGLLAVTDVRQRPPFSIPLQSTRSLARYLSYELCPILQVSHPSSHLPVLTRSLSLSLSFSNQSINTYSQRNIHNNPKIPPYRKLHAARPSAEKSESLARPYE